MGLDMYAYSIEKADLPQVDFEINRDDPTADTRTEIYYWRKHHDLHGWMHQLYTKKGGQSPVFNCDNVRLMPEDLDQLEQDVKEGKLPATTGFFFGNFPPDDESKKEDLEFIRLAREAIANGDAVYYTSWW